MSKHTPSPWIATDAYQVITDWPKVGFLTTVANCRIGGGGSDEWQANARLIAAAPDLLEVAKKLIAYETAMDASNDVIALNLYAEASETARAAIAKAEGRT